MRWTTDGVNPNVAKTCVRRSSERDLAYSANHFPERLCRNGGGTKTEGRAMTPHSRARRRKRLASRRSRNGLGKA